MPRNVYVRVNQTGKHRQFAEIIIGAFSGANLLDLAVLDDDVCVVLDAALAVEQRSNTQHYRVLLGIEGTV